MNSITNRAASWSGVLASALLALGSLNCSAPSGDDASSLTADLSRGYCRGAGRGTAACGGATGSTGSNTSTGTGTTTGSSGGASTGSTVNSGSTTSTSAADPSQSDGVATIQFKNNCGYAIEVSGSAAGSDFQGGAYVGLAAGASFNHNLGAEGVGYPALRYYGRKPGTDPGAGNFTLAEFTLNSSFQNLDYYDVSLVDAFNLPVGIAAIGASCPAPTCAANLLSSCPASGQLSSNGQVVSCTKHGDVDAASNPEAALFHSACPDAYAYSTDDQGTKACNAQDYRVTFCP